MDSNQLIVKPSTYLKDKSQLPPHITYKQYVNLRESVIKHWEQKKKFSENYVKIVNRDLLLIDYMWETGGRIGDIVNITFKDFEGRLLNLYTKKRKKSIVLDISPELYGDTLNYMRKFKVEETQLLFPITIQRAWQIIRQYAVDINFPRALKMWKSGKEKITTLRPHLFRHGMAIHLLNQNVRIEVISARLGHSNIKITMDMYLKVTPEIQHLHLQNVQWR